MFVNAKMLESQILGDKSGLSNTAWCGPRQALRSVPRVLVVLSVRSKERSVRGILRGGLANPTVLPNFTPDILNGLKHPIKDIC